MDPFIYSLIILMGIGVVIVIVALRNIRKAGQMATKRYRSFRGYRTVSQRYVTGQFGGQMELDLRLPYRRFKQLYPQSTWTYEEYKKMQMQSAFKRSLSSQDNKRMVR